MPFFIVLAYVVILVLGVSISGYLSYGGLLRTGQEITVPLVILLMLIILVMDATISYFRSQQRKYMLPLFIWAIAAFFSISSNFNFLYSNFMREDVSRQTVTEQIAVFRDNLVETRGALSGMDAVTFAKQTGADLEVELKNLYDQINDPLRPGCGAECRTHMERIENILGREITNMAVPQIGSEMPVVNAWFGRYRAAAEEILETSLNTTQAPQILALIRQIDAALLEFRNTDRVMATKGGLDALADMSAHSLDIEREANALLPENKGVSHSRINPTLGRLGEIVYAFQNGFGEMPNPMATAVSLVLASVVDVLPLLLSFALFGKGRLEKTVKTGTMRGVGGRRVIGD